jgi:DNA-binding GntR family transcriptional regulator
LSADEAREITDLRCLLEGEILGRAMPRLTQADLAHAHALVDRLDTATGIDDIVRLNAQFHTALYARADRPKTLAMIETLRLNFERYLRLTWEETPHLRHSQREHRAVLRLCAKDDRKGAIAALREHILATGETIIRRLAQR